MFFLQSLIDVKCKPVTSVWTEKLVIKALTVVEGDKTIVGADDGSQIAYY